MRAYRQRTGETLTYQKLASQTGLARWTLESIATRANYNASLRVIAKICGALGCTLDDLLELERPSPASKRRQARPARQDRST